MRSRDHPNNSLDNSETAAFRRILRTSLRADSVPHPTPTTSNDCRVTGVRETEAARAAEEVVVEVVGVVPVGWKHE